MEVDLVGHQESFEALRPAWERVHADDHESDYFTSWRWLDQVFRANPRQWLVLAVRNGAVDDDGAYVCFLPLRVKPTADDGGSTNDLDLEAAGRLSWGQYTGLVCSPRHETAACAALGAALAQLPWRRMRMRNCAMSSERSRAFLHPFSGQGFDVGYGRPPRPAPEVDNLVCPFVTLPDKFDAYLQSAVSANTRQKIRRYARRVEDDPGLRFSVSDATVLHRDLDRLLELWRQKWGPVRGDDTARHVMARYREVLAQSAALGAVFLLALWRDDAMLGAVASIVDHDKRRMYFIVAGRDESACDPFIGLVLHAHSIRWAIEHGITTYDFCHGNEPYKYSFGCSERRLFDMTVTRKASDAAASPVSSSTTVEADATVQGR